MFYTSTSYSFEIIYGFNPLIPLDLLPFPINEIASLDGKQKVDLVKRRFMRKHENKSCKRMNKLLPKQTKERSKLPLNQENGFGFIFARNDFPTIGIPSWGDGLFKILIKINDNVYQIDLFDKYEVDPTFNSSNIFPFYAKPDSRTNPFQEGGQ